MAMAGKRREKGTVLRVDELTDAGENGALGAHYSADQSRVGLSLHSTARSFSFSTQYPTPSLADSPKRQPHREPRSSMVVARRPRWRV